MRARERVKRRNLYRKLVVSWWMLFFFCDGYGLICYSIGNATQTSVTVTDGRSAWTTVFVQVRWRYQNVQLPTISRINFTADNKITRKMPGYDTSAMLSNALWKGYSRHTLSEIFGLNLVWGAYTTMKGDSQSVKRDHWLFVFQVLGAGLLAKSAFYRDLCLICEHENLRLVSK